ncbi:2,4-dienoyl-CoA reductase-like NADH-dependent reductase (Old Yellow Enzyme family) [Paraburkholderia sp. BL6669N2]|uniref:NADH:flavin oxidoreductase/NADH oxidase n=1 Tax=Paraburkholderia sp. BL6669N2 TaxID=1938807 RepID=UPI000E2649A3|nr:NADH:flavin oxidoreductase/NADH oxidase [Paraburkholderia sp. BL6669N2]REG49037.1 2,4-dienoyl-CoA reductase-like NADH-dependent reductase (Old Yellow Enzyme family) [Paraburkholderia sp. BL6669N2]
MTSALFSPVTIGPVTLPNRIVVSPMCQYSADDGCANDWHQMHLMQLAMSGAGLIVLEATATERHARITHGCLGLYSDANEASIARVMDAARRVAAKGTKWGIQLSHAGRKSSAQRPWEGRAALGPLEDPWQTESPSALAAGADWHTPKEMTRSDMDRVRDGFVAAAVRAARLGFDVVEIHAAHGYLIHQFLSPIANLRTDAYGGSLENRMAFPLEIAVAVRKALPDNVGFGLRITGSDWTPEGLGVADAVAFASALKEVGADYVCVSSGGIATVRIPVGPNYQVPFAAEVKANVGIHTRAVGMIAEANQAEEIIASGQADTVAVGRAFLDNPRWVWHAAERLGAEDQMTYPPQYERSKRGLWAGAKLARPVADSAK